MDKHTRHAISTSLVVGLITLPIMAVVYITHQDIILLFGILAITMLTMLLFARPLLGLPALLVVRPAIDILGDRSFTFGTVNINVAAIMSILAILWALWILVPHWKKVMDLPIFWPAALFFGISVWSLFLSVSPTATVTEIVRLGACFLLLFVALWQTKNVQDLQRIFRGFAAGLAIPVVVALYQVITNSGLTFAESVNRAYGTFGHPNVLAFYLVLAILALLGARTAFPHDRTTHPSIIIVLAITLVLTQTRGAWLGVILGLGYIGLVRYRQALLVGAISLVAVSFILPALQGSLAGTSFDIQRAPVIGPILQRQFNTSSLDWRLDVWREMEQRFTERPVFGFGLGTFPTLRQLQVFDIYDQGIGAHNDYLRLLIELGIAGIVFYAILLFSFARNLRDTINHYQHTTFSNLPLFLVAFFLAFLAMSYFDNLLQATPVMWAWCILLGATIATRPTKKGN
jgi:O-antigen ligase